jgi:putative ABC transport system permease protein
MTLVDMIELAFDNLRRTKLRTSLTVLGVVIGIGALASMVALGTGIQRNITDAFKQNDLFTTMFVTAKGMSLEEIGTGDPDAVMDAMRQAPALTDSTLAAVLAVPGVEIAFPEISFPVRVRFEGREARTNLRALPAAMGGFKPYNQLAYGRFFDSDTSAEAVISWDTLKRMKIAIEGEGGGEPAAPSDAPSDTSQATLVVGADSVIGRPVEVISVVLDPSKLAGAGMLGLMAMRGLPTTEHATTLRLGGVLKRPTAFSEGQIQGGIMVPMRTAQAIPSLGFSTVWDLLGRGAKPGGYSSIYVRVKRPADMQAARGAIEKMGLHVFSVTDELREIRRGFLVVDSILGAIGTIALVVAALGIANTMVMSILERTREIGIMKAIGASEGQIKTIFFVEAGTIGAVGGVLGLVLGWGVTRLANLVVNARLVPEGEAPMDLFHFPAWLVAGALGFAVVVSLVAGLYPAVRAAAVDPIEALRHD